MHGCRDRSAVVYDGQIEGGKSAISSQNRILTPYFKISIIKTLLQKRRNQRWCIDFTYLYFGKHKKCYNCTIIDLYDRRVVASVNGKNIDAQLAITTVAEAIRRSNGEVCDFLHSDRGSQFTSKAFIEFCKNNGIQQSMSKPGYPYDNAPMERYYNTLKTELIYQKKFRTEEELYAEVNAYAYGWYNNLRPHMSNGGLAPAKVN